MKKFFSLIALAGVIAACTPEQVDTAFKLAGGKVLVNVELVDIVNGGTYSGDVDIRFVRGNLDVTQEFSPIVGSGPHAYLWQAEESQAVSAEEYFVVVKSANFARDYSSWVTFPEVLAGGEASIKVIVPVGEPLNGWTVMAQPDKDKVESWTEYGYLVNSHYPTHAYSHKGIDTWYYNNSEYLLEGSVKYTWEKVGSVSNVVDKKIVGFENVVTNFEDEILARYAWDGDTEEYPFTVSAWAMWQVVQAEGHIFIPILFWAYQDKNNNGEEDSGEEHLDLGSLDFEYVFSNLIQKVELPYPGAPSHAHYHEGHGHDAHGSAANAGGGISFNE